VVSFSRNVLLRHPYSKLIELKDKTNLFVANETDEHIFSAEMSLAQIIEELPKLTPEERRTIYQQIERLDGELGFEPTSEMLAAIDEGTRSAQAERMYTADEIKERVRQWANSSSE
jgi:anaerobic ribonucleoside-triphosphate reductase